MWSYIATPLFAIIPDAKLTTGRTLNLVFTVLFIIRLDIVCIFYRWYSRVGNNEV